MPIRPGGVLRELLDEYGKAPADFAFFVGAGLSAPLFPLWGSFLEALLRQAEDRSGVDLPVAEIEAHIRQGRYFLEIASLLADNLPENAYREILERNFDRQFTPDQVPGAYRELLALPSKVVVTTNYDRIPDALGGARFRIYSNRQAGEASRSLQRGDPFVFKLHGDIVDQGSIVLTARDYREIVHHSGGPRDVLASILKARRVIFLGFSLADPHVTLVLETIAGLHQGVGPSQYALLSNVTRFEQRSIESRYGVKVIPYKPSDGSHPEVFDFVRALGKAAETEGDIQVSEAFQTVARDTARYESHDPRGIMKVVDSNHERIRDYKQCLMEGAGRCFISGTSMIHLTGDSRAILKEKALQGEVHLLILDPDWIEANWALLTFLRGEEERREFHREIRASVVKLRSLRDELEDESPGSAANLKLRAYRTIFPYIVTGWESGDYGKMVVEVTDYLPDESRPRFTLHRVDSGESLFRQVRDKFDALWNNRHLTTEILP